MDEKRLEQIESKIAHQEHLLAELNEALVDQQAQLLQIKALCDMLLERVRAMSDASSSGDSPDERPPHY